MLQFLRKTKTNSLPLEFCEFMQKPFRRCFRSPLHLPPHNCQLFHNFVSQRWRLKTTGQVSPVQVSYIDKLSMKLDVNHCYHAFQEDCYLISKSISCMTDLKIFSATLRNELVTMATINDLSSIL